ncbi:MAG: four helix bundle protein [Marinilabiliales bacterium]|nr:MAG: four helix bundle protein [Marinilabiliales bacterium]
MRLYSFEKLNVWQLSRTLVKNVYEISNMFPDEEKFGLVSQIRRASISVSSNIAEGTSRKSGKDQARFTEISYGSLLEVLNQLILAADLGYISSNIVDEQRQIIEEIGNKLNKLRETQLNK